MSSSGNYQIITIELETIFGEDPEMDEMFTSYLDEYSISHKLVEADGELQSKWPRLQYTGGPISLSNMLQERFGYTPDEISVEFPQINEAMQG